MTSRTCNKCGENKDISKYEGTRKKCKDCRKIEAQKRIEDRKIQQKCIETQVCSKCNENKRIEEFKLGELQCKSCIAKYHKLRIDTNIRCFLSVLCSTAKKLPLKDY